MFPIPVSMVSTPGMLLSKPLVQQLDIRAEQGAFLISNLFTLQKKLPVTVGTFAVRYIK